MVVAIAGIASAPWLVALAPIVLLVFLLAPAFGIYRHDETPAPLTDVRLEAFPFENKQTESAGVLCFRLFLVNDGAHAAEDFRVRLLIPETLVPLGSRIRPLGALFVGEMGRNWFIETGHAATTITLRTAPRGSAEEITCPPASRQELADLLLPIQLHPLDASLDYQVNGGSVRAVLAQLRLVS